MPSNAWSCLSSVDDLREFEVVGLVFGGRMQSDSLDRFGWVVRVVLSLTTMTNNKRFEMTTF